MRFPRFAITFILPVQSGSTRILRAMRRTYTREEYLEKISWIRGARRPISMTTDIIVGFPGETDDGFRGDAHAARCRRLRRRFLLQVFAAAEYAAARDMPDAIPEEEKSRAPRHFAGAAAPDSNRAQRETGRRNDSKCSSTAHHAARDAVVRAHHQQPHHKFRFAASKIFWDNTCR